MIVFAVYIVAGIIPALAGSTCVHLVQRTRTWDHPRSRGEHAVGVVQRQVEFGIIPALAGSTSPPR